MYQGKGGKRPYKDRKPARQIPEAKIDPDILSKVVETGLHDVIPPMRWLIEGGPKTGKSTYAKGWPGKVLYLNIERGLSFILGIQHLPIDKTGQIKSVYYALAKDPARAGFRTIVFDTLDKLFDLYAQEVCPKGALGIQEYQPIYRQIVGMFDAFRRLGLHVIAIAHEVRREDKSTERVSYTSNLPGRLGQDVTALVDHIVHTAVDDQGRYGVILRKNAKYEAGGRLPGVPAFVYLAEGESLWEKLEAFYAAYVAGERVDEGDPDPFAVPDREPLVQGEEDAEEDHAGAEPELVVTGELDTAPPAPQDEKLTDSRSHTEAATIILPRQETPPPAAPPARDVQAELAAHNAKARELREREDAAKAAAIAVPTPEAPRTTPAPETPKIVQPSPCASSATPPTVDASSRAPAPVSPPPAPAGAQGSIFSAAGKPPVTVPGKLWAAAVEYCRGNERQAVDWLSQQTGGKASDPAKMPEKQAAAILAQVERCLAAGTHYGELAPAAPPKAGKPRVATMAQDLWKALLARYGGDERKATDWLVVNTGRDDIGRLDPKEARHAKEQLEAEIHDEEQLALEEAARADAGQSEEVAG